MHPIRIRIATATLSATMLASVGCADHGTDVPDVPGVDGTGDSDVPGVDGTDDSDVPGVDGTDDSDVPGVDGTDDSDVPGGGGITVDPTTGLTTTETGGTAVFTVVLDSEPAADVTIALSSGDTSEGTVAPASVTFTPLNWNAPQAATATGVDDALVDGDRPYAVVTAPAVSTDGDYGGMDPTDVSVRNLDNDSPRVRVLSTACSAAARISMNYESTTLTFAKIESDTTNNILYGLRTNGEIWHSLDYGNVWTYRSTVAWAQFQLPSPLFVDSRGYVYAVTYGNFYVSTDRALSWRRATIPLSSSVHSVIWNIWEMPDGTLLAGEYGYWESVRPLVFRSDDGVTWTVLLDQTTLDPLATHTHVVAYEPTTSRVYITHDAAPGGAMKTYFAPYGDMSTWARIPEGSGETAALLVSDGILLFPDVGHVIKHTLAGATTMLDLGAYSQGAVYDGTTYGGVAAFHSSNSGIPFDDVGLWMSPDDGNSWVEIYRDNIGRDAQDHAHMSNPIGPNRVTYVSFSSYSRDYGRVFRFEFPDGRTAESFLTCE